MTSYFSFIFLAAFLPAVVVLYAVAPRRTRWVVLLIASYAFFFWLSRTLILALWASTLSIYLTGLGLGALIRQRDAAVKAVKSGKREIRARYARKMKLVLAAVPGFPKRRICPQRKSLGIVTRFTPFPNCFNRFFNCCLPT